MKIIEIIVICISVVLLSGNSKLANASLWTPEKILLQAHEQNLSCCFQVNNPFMGIFGTDCHRIDICLLKSLKQNDSTYLLNGKSRFKNSVCPFEGIAVINEVKLLDRPVHTECVAVDGYLTGYYRLDEPGTGNCCGKFSDTFSIAIHITETGKICPAILEVYEMHLNGISFSGKWIVCCWSDNEIPCIPNDFCTFTDAAEWIVSHRYREKGWQTYYDAYYNEALTADEKKKPRERKRKNGGKKIRLFFVNIKKENKFALVLKL